MFDDNNFVDHSGNRKREPGPHQQMGLSEQDREEFRLGGAETSSWELPARVTGFSSIF